MKLSSFTNTAVNTVIVLTPLIVLANVYKTLPSTVALHFGISGQPDRFGNKSELIWNIFILTVVNAGVFLLVTNLHRFDPKRAAKLSKHTMQKIATAVALLLSLVCIFIILTARDNNFKLFKFILPIIGLFFAYMGNLMYSIKPNYFAGIRTPWTLEDEDTWRKTHQLAGKLWFAAGLLITIATLLVPLAWKLPVFISIVAVIVLIPVVYSYTYYKSHVAPDLKGAN